MQRYSMRWLYALMFICLATSSFGQTTNQFSESAASWNVDIGGNKDGGVAFGDYDDDGDPDIFLNTNNGTGDSRVYRNDGTSYTDVTTTVANGLLSQTMERQAVWADFNNDGRKDFARSLGSSGGSDKIQIWLSNPGPTFGDGAGGTTPITVRASGGIINIGANNIEGLGAIDFDGDGDLDIMIENHNYGIDLLRNNRINHTTGALVAVTPATHFTIITTGCGDPCYGLDQSATDGDYSAVGDMDNDGWVDIVARKHDGDDVYYNTGTSFGFATNLDDAANGDKGGIGLYDLDNDGDLDIVWTSAPGNRIYRNNGDRTWTDMTTAFDASFRTNTAVDGVTGGDIDNDGDIDLFFTDNGSSFMFINQLNDPVAGPNTGSTFDFNNYSFVASGTNNGDGEGCAMADVDGDGDLDIYVNINGSANKLWINNLYNGATPFANKNYIEVDISEIRPNLMTGGNNRPYIGATAVLKDCSGNIIGPLQSVDGGSGHGSQNEATLHFGLPNGNNALYFVEIAFPNELTYSTPSTRRLIVSKAINPTIAGTAQMEVLPHEPDISCDNYFDNDGDGVYNPDDLDDDNDGIPDYIEICGPSATDFSCLAGILTDGVNPLDPSGDEDGDGIPNYIDARDPGVVHAACVDANLDGYCDAINPALDADQDSIPDFFDLDTDNDGVADIIEAGGVDTDGDGRVDGAFADGDNDGLHNTYDTDNGGDDIAFLDSDGDGIYNFEDLDSDNDGIPDVIEMGGTDANDDGRQDETADSDRDGLDDAIDGDVGNDGTAENTAAALVLTGTDTDADGRPNSITRGDVDGDGYPSFIDLDSDNDGKQDIIEAGGVDANDDGVVDGAFSDPDGDGLHTTYDANDGGTSIDNTDSDNDGIPDALSLDSDGDGIPDIIEMDGIDTDGNGMVDGAYTDTDTDGWHDFYDPNNGGFAISDPDTDGDGIRDVIDLDTDNDGIPDVIEVGGTDANDDGRLDATADTDNDGLDDSVDSDIGNDNTAENTSLALRLTGGDGTTVDGAPDTYVNGDTDGDGQQDEHDLDSDGDGIPDIIEAGGIDTDGNGTVDGAFADGDGDGLHSTYDPDDGGHAIENRDSDGDGVLNFKDLDSDNDGITDVTEAGGTDGNQDGILDPTGDADNDGLDDAVDPDADGNGSLESPNAPLFTTGGDGTTVDGAPESYVTITGKQNPNPDGDLFANPYDKDSDGDGLTDLAEAGGVDTNGDGTVDGAFSDSDEDGLHDTYDVNDGGDHLIPVNSDADLLVDYLDLDSDNDGITDVAESGGTDADDNGIQDGAADTDNDGLQDAVDGDVGNDGVAENTAAALILTGTDTDSDGIPNSLTRGDLDGDNRFNFRDLDADNDGVQDILEAGGVDANNDGIVDGAFADPDNDGLHTTYDANNGGTAIDNTDTDGDNIPNARSLDSDGDGIPDLIEYGGIDTDGNGLIDGAMADGDTDGWHDLYDVNDGGFAIPQTDFDGDGILDALDLDSDNDGIPDVLEAGGLDANDDGILDATADTDNDGLDDSKDSDIGNDNTAENTAIAARLTGGDGVSVDGRPESFTRGDGDGDNLRSENDLDSDNDGITDLIEARGVDTNGDGIVDGLFSDGDSDGLHDTYDANDGGDAINFPDSDNDDIPNTQDLDSDNDGYPDILEVGGTDADNDGMVDAVGDIDNDGLIDALDGDVGNDGTTENTAGASVISGVDGDFDGIPDNYIRGDFDLDGFLNSQDLDSDNDGILDVRENNFADSNYDGIADGAPTGGAKANGWSDAFDGNAGGSFPNPLNNDLNTAGANGDANLNYLDIDSDNDGIPDIIEGQSTAGFIAPAGADADGDGIDDAFDNNDAEFGGDPNNGIAPVNTEGPGSIPDYIDFDSDNDGIYDDLEGWDANANGVLDGPEPYWSGVDSDGDGLDDVYDAIVRGSDPGNNPLNSATPIGFPDNQAPGGDRDWRDPGPITPLPLVWGAFTAEWMGQQGLLQWTTLSEINTSHFEIWHSTDLENWNLLGETQAAGFSSVELSYQFMHVNPDMKMNYYRIRQLDLDGAWEYSEIRTLQGAGQEGNHWQVYPNPIQNQAFIPGFKGEFILMNLSGQVLMQGNAHDQIQGLEQLPAGMYVLQLNMEGIQQHIRLLKN